MIRDTEWHEELRNDPALRSFVKMHEDAFDKIFKEWAISRLEHFEKRRNLGALSVEYIFQQLQQQGSITIYEYMEPEEIIPYLQEATFETDRDRKLYRRYYKEFRKDYECEGKLTNYNLSYLMEYMTVLAVDFAYHYIKIVHENDRLTSDATPQENPKLFSAPISSLNPNESTPEGKENLKAVVRLVGRFQTKVTPQPQPLR